MKSNKQFTWLFFFLLVISVFSSIVLADDHTIEYTINEVIEKPNPLINVTYVAEDAPLVLSEYTLYYENGNPVLDSNFNPALDVSNNWSVHTAYIPGSNAYDKYQFAVNKFLPPGKYFLDIKGYQYDTRAEDTIGKDHHLIIDFTINAESMNMWVTSPRIDFIAALKQDVAVGDSEQFELSIQTAYATTCTIQREPTVQGEFSDYYNAGDRFNQGSNQASETHTITVMDQRIGDTNDELVLTIPGEFNYQTYQDSANYLILCKEDLIDGTSFYHPKILYIGYDTSEPDITVEFNPEEIIDRNDMITNLSVTSTQDFVSCEYEYTQLPPESITGKSNLPTTPLRIKDSFNGIADFETNLQAPQNMQTSPKWTYGYLFNQPYLFEVNVVCENLAGRLATRQASFNVTLSSEMEFEVINENGFTLYEEYPNYADENPEIHVYTDENPEIHVQTSLLSTCTYTYNDETVIIDTEPTRDHIFTFDKEEFDKYNVMIDLACETPFSNDYDYYTINIAKDSTPPQDPVFDGEEFTCDGGIGVSINDPYNEHTTIPYGENGDNLLYEYALYEGNTLLSTGQTNEFTTLAITLDENSFDTPIALTNNDFDKDYRWDVTAIDGVGYRSSSSFSVQRLDQYNPRCDTQAPTATVDAILSPSGYEVSVLCDDLEENCAASFLYAQLSLGESCEDAELKSHRADQPLRFEEDVLLCYQVYDLADPENQYSEIYSLEITPEINIQLISPNSGVGTQSAFTFEIQTQSRNDRLLTCKHGPYSVAVAEMLEDDRDYQGIYELVFLEDFEESNGVTHSFTFNANSNSQIGSYFDGNAASDIQDWVIACKEEGVDVYPVRKIQLGFDTTPPEFTIAIEPTRVENPQDMSTLLSLESDEVVFCEYADIINNPGLYTKFPGVFFEEFQTYETTHETTINYTTRDVFDVNQEVRCYNLAGRSSTQNIEYRVQPKGDIEIILNTTQFYDTQNVQLEARTPGLWADCSLSVDGEEYEEFNIATGQEALTYVHKHQINVEDGTHTIQVSCDPWFSGLEGYAYAEIVVDTQDPLIDIQARDPSCSATSIYANILTDGTGSEIVEQSYDLEDPQGVSIASGPLTEFELTLNNLNLEIGEQYKLTIYAEDQIGRTSTASAIIEAATQENPECDVTQPISTIDTRDIYGGIEFTVGCFDAETSCTDSFYYYFDETGACLFEDPEIVQSARYNDQPIIGEESSTFCYFTTDEGLNPSVKQGYTYSLQQSCYNGLYDTNENGVDCGGNCALQDCGICYNDEFDDAWEESTDCGNVCSSICSDGGFITLAIVDMSPQFGVSQTKDFIFSITTNRNAQCRFGKYNPDLPLGYQELYAQMRSLDYAQSFSQNFNGQEHSISVNGDEFAGSSGLDMYMESIIIICKEFDDYVPTILPYFGFDTTPPSMTVLAEPNPTIDPSFLESKLLVTTDDLTICKYTDIETGTQDFFPGEDYYEISSYQEYREYNLNYWAQDASDDVQRISCTNLAGASVEEDYTIQVRPEYSQQITIANDGLYYTQTSGQILLEVQTDLYASCQYRLSPEDEYVDMDKVNPFLGLSGSLALATQHERQIFVEDGIVDLEIKCNMLYDWFGSEEYQFAQFVQDSTPPILEVSLYEKTCSLDRLRVDIAATDEATQVESLAYAISVNGDTLRELTSVNEPWNSVFEPVIDLANYEGDYLTLSVVATDSAGNIREEFLTSQITDVNDPLCDNIPPTMSFELEPVWSGYNLEVACQDEEGGSGCDEDYGYSFSNSGSCDELYAPWSIGVNNIFSESGTLCFRVKDLRPNYAPTQTQQLDINPNCYNYQWDIGEEGIDCGLDVCAIACEDITCENGVEDAFEEGIDCGGVCQSVRSCIGCSGPQCDASCNNGAQDYNEDGIDCGGVCSSECSEPIDPNAPLEIVLVTPEFGIAQTKTFTLELFTSKPATCKQGYLAPLHPSETSEWYDRLDGFTQTGQLTHSITMSSNDISRSGEDPEENAYPWIIICEEQGKYYEYPLDALGYDITPPNIVLELTPRTINNPGDISAELTVTSDDEVVCTYLDKRGDSRYFLGEDVGDVSTYTFERSEQVSYEGPNLVDYDQIISCRNIAQASSSVTDSVVVDLENRIQITTLTELYQNSRVIDLEVQTTPAASCVFKVLDDGDEISFAQTGSTSHYSSVSLDEGENEVLITCTNLGTGFVGSEYTTIIVDTQEPTILIEGTSPSCSLDELKARFFVDDETTTIESFTYDVLYQGDIIASGEIFSNELVESFPLVEGGRYTIRATASDTVGLETQASTEIIASTQNNPDCDFNAPSASLFTQDTWGGVDVTVTCVDQESGCNDLFNYYTADSCGADFSEYDLGYLSRDNPLFIESSTSFCAIVYDNAGNPSSEEIATITVVEQCYNGIEDPDEAGVDCGGPCVASCGTCYNGIKDQFEGGVDCDGVCSSITSCNEPPVEPTDFAITLLDPAFGLANTRQFSLSAYTTKDAQCRHGYMADISISLEDRYRLFQGFDSSGQQFHSAALDAADIIQLNPNIDEDETQWGIICVEDNQYYLKSIPRFGFDISEPVLSISYTPELVFDPGDMTSTILVQSDDEIVCTYLDRFGDTNYFNRQDVNDPNTYETTMEATVTYWGYAEELHEQEITCRNLAQTSTQQQKNILIQPDNTLETNIILNDYYGRGETIGLLVTTQVDAYCEYMIDGAFAQMRTTGGKSHEQFISVGDGEYTATVLCQSIGLGLSSTISQDFVVDTQDPIIEIVLGDETCSLSRMDFLVYVDGTGSSYQSYTYQISSNGEILEDDETNEIEVSSSLSLEEGNLYTVSVRAIDLAGNVGQASERTVASITSDTCDTTPPRGGVVLETQWNGVHVDVTCEDDESGCTNYFAYRDTGIDEELSIGYYTTSLPLIYNEDTEFDYAVFDNAGNEFADTISLDVEKQCFNGFEDPNEEGVDCGGICQNQCLTCNNGVQDPFEGGIDCGGICTQECVGSGELNIDLVEPTFGIATTKTFLLEVETNYDAVCRSGYDTSSSLDNIDRYGDLEEMETTGERLHSVEIAASRESQLNAISSESTTKWIVICQANGEFRSLEIPELGFDTTPAQLTILAQPNPVTNPSTLRSELSVNSDDPVVCTYLDENGESVYFAENDITSQQSYDTTHRTLITYWGVEEYDDNQLIICRNLAQQPSLEEITIRVRPENQISMTFILDEYSNSNTVELDVSTLQNTYCTYSTTSAGPSADFDSTGGRSHSKSLFLNEGEHTIEVICTDQDTGLLGVEAQTIFVDTITPAMEILSNDASCSLGTYLVSVLADGTGSNIQTYEYQVKDGNQILNSGELDGPQLRIPLRGVEEDSVYDVEITLFDDAGNSISELFSFLATRDTHPLCDEDNPQIDSRVEYVWDGAEITVLCEDGQSGCAPYYSQFMSFDSCRENNYELTDYVDENPFMVLETSTACYRVYDNAGNFASAQETIELEQRCFNGFEDPDESGVDCGGPCSASCGTCNNNQQDQYEEGVDCGGVCSSIRVCQNPSDLEISLLSPRLGFSATKTIDFSVYTNNWAYCRGGLYQENHPSQNVDWYDTLSEFSSTGGTVHEVQLRAESISSLNANAEEDSVLWAVVCEDQGLYAAEVFTIGFDTTQPSIELIAQPNPVSDPTNMKTVLGVLSNDPVVCTYLGEEGESIYFEGNVVDEADSYGTQQSTTISYWSRNNQEDQQLVICRNKALLTNTAGVTIAIAANNEFDVSISTPALTTDTTINLQAETSVSATCSYDITGKGNFIEFASGEGTQHSELITLRQGVHEVIVSCSDSQGNSGFAYKEITVDYTPPKLDILISQESCSLSQISATLFMDGTFSSMDSYEYRLLQNRNEVAQGSGTNYELTIQTGLSANQEYTLEVTAYDELGNTQIETQDFIASNPESPNCDTIPPVGSAITEITWQGAESTITCQDQESGCSQLFHYTYIDGGICENAQYTPADAAFDNPLITTESATLCYAVYDNANNKFEDSELIDITNYCFNGFEDPTEEGVDCGGPCEASCDVCANGAQDVFEEGIDCGGICSLSCDQEASPENFRIDIANPRFGVASTENFIFEVQTTQYASCRHGYLANAKPNTIGDWYNTLGEFTYSDGRTHNVQIRAENIAQLDASATESITSWVVICKDENEYLIEELQTFGFDKTPAQLEVSASPNPIVDPGNAVTTIYVQSDDAVACTYQDKDGITHYFENIDITSSRTYKTGFSVSLEHWGLDKSNYDSTISCRNIAQLSSEDTINIAIALSNSVGITIDMEDYYGDNRVLVSATTDQLATCSFRFSEDEPYEDFAVFSSYEHQRSYNLEEGEHTVEVSCVSDSTGDTATQYFDFGVDTKNPEVSVLIGDTSCGLDELLFTIQSDGTGSDVASYSYDVEFEGEVIASRNTDKSAVAVPIELEEGSTYKIEVTAYDEAGNEARSTETVRATTYDPLTCDTTKPRGNVQLKESWNGIEATIICEDNENCTALFDYKLDAEGQCGEGYQSGYYESDLPLLIKEETTLCYAVYDQAKNSYEGSIDISYEASCFNGEEDPSEAGVDCGGTCLAECGTCRNSIKDIYEEGIDCGGVCETIRSCSDIAGLYDEFVDSDGDGMDDSWEEFHFGNLDQDGISDYDEDGLTNFQEYQAVTNPTKKDTDGDGLSDLWEITFFNDLDESAQGDSDGDSLTNIIEFTIGTDPTIKDITDADKDGLADQWETYYFGSLDESAQGDPDDDGISNLEEYLELSDPTVFNTRAECETDTDCSYGFKCDYTLTCVVDEYLNDDIFDEVEPGINVVGLVLLILGILFIAAGITYIVFSRKQVEKETKQVSAKEIAKRREATRVAKEKQEAQEAALLKKKTQAAQQARAKRLAERKKQRKNILGMFGQDEKSPTIPKQESASTSKTTLAMPKKSSKLDEGLEEDFVDIRDLGKGASKKKEPIKKDLVKKSTEDVFESLSKLSSSKKQNTKSTEKKKK